MREGPSDAALVLAARRGDKEAFARLVERHHGMLLALCRRALGEATRVEDASQEAVLQALLSLDRLRRPERFGPWLGGIGLNVCRRWLRAQRTEPRSWEELVGGYRVDEPVDWRSPQDLAEEAEVVERIRGAVAELPAGQRAAVALYYLHGLTLAEVASQLEVDAGAVKQRLHKGRSNLRRALRDIREEPTMQSPGEPLVDARVVDVRRTPAAGDRPTQYIIILEEVSGSRRLPIWIGRNEGDALALQLEGIELPRPATFAFTASILRASGGILQEVVVNRLVDKTFYAEAVIEQSGRITRLDARPSDAINLAVLLGAPIRVADEVFREAAAPSNDLPWEQTGTLSAKEITAEVVASWQPPTSRTE